MKIMGIETRDTSFAKMKAADQAKRMASMNVGRKSATATASVPKDFRSLMSDVYDRIAAGG